MAQQARLGMQGRVRFNPSPWGLGRDGAEPLQPNPSWVGAQHCLHLARIGLQDPILPPHGTDMLGLGPGALCCPYPGPVH